MPLITNREVDYVTSSSLSAAGSRPRTHSGFVAITHARPVFSGWEFFVYVHLILSSGTIIGCGYQAPSKRDFMSASSGGRGLSLALWAHGVCIDPLGYAGPVPGTSSVLAGYVDGMADWDIACDWDIARPEQAQAVTFKVIPSTAPVFVTHYRTPFTATWQFRSRACSLPEYRHYVTMCQTGVVVVRPRGPLGFIGVRLRPEAAACLLGERMPYLLDAWIGLDDLFGSSRVSLLEEALAAARTSAERFACVERFLAANLREHGVNAVACRARRVVKEQAGRMLPMRPGSPIRHI